MSKRYIEIHGRKIFIEDANGMDDDFGKAEIEDETIYINKNLRTSKNERKTLLHEVIHMCLLQGGISFALTEKMEEAIVRCLENGLRDSVQLKIKKL